MTPDQKKLSEELVALRKDYFDLREKFASFREQEFLTVKDKTNDISLKITIFGIIFGVVAAILAFFGYEKYARLDELVNKTVHSKIDDTIGYIDKLIKNLTLINIGNCQKATPQMKELTDKRQDDEVVILNLLYCYIISDRYDEGYEYVEKLKALKILPYKLQDLLSFNNSGFIIFMQSLDKPELTSQAYDLLTRAEQIGTADNNPDIKYPFSSMVYYYIMNGELGKASVYVERLRELDITLLDEFEEDKKKNWYKKMENKRPSIQDDLRKLIPKKVNN